MNMLLRILVIVTLIVNGVALWFSTELYKKRELLKDRNDLFRDFAVEIAQTFEAAEPEARSAADKEARDISEVSLATADITPDTSDFWESYHIEYEDPAAAFYQIPDVAALDEVYTLDAEGKPKLNNRTGKPDPAGSPLDLSLQDVIKMAEAQRDRLTTVRGQLTKLREEYEATVADLNQVKKQGRESLKTIAARDETIAGLEADKSRLEGEVADRDAQIETLEGEKQSLQADLDKATEERDALADEVENLKKTLEEIATGGQGGANADGMAAIANVTAGVKGTVVRVDNAYNFAIVKLTPEALVELIGEEGERPLPEADFLVSRPGKQDTIIGKVRLRTITKDAGVIVCDILADWKQADVQEGDEVFYLD